MDLITSEILPPELYHADSPPNFNLKYYTSNPFQRPFCTWYAYGRAWEVLDYYQFPKPTGLNGDAINWFNTTVYSTGNIPRAASIAVWGGRAE